MRRDTDLHGSPSRGSGRDPSVDADVAVIGAGVVGAAVARALARAGRDVLILERARASATVGTARNSGVVHAGLYYAHGSRKARTCVRGRHLLWSFVADHGVAHAKIGKLVVATSAPQVERLHALHEHARENGVERLEWLSGTQALARCPSLRAPHAALWSPESGIVDPIALTRALLRDAQARGANVAFGVAVTSWARARTGVIDVQSASGETVSVRHVVSAAGFEGALLARRLGLPVTHRACVGRWVRVSTTPRLSHLVYPVRAPGDPGLGIHATLDLGGGVRFGPDTVWAPESVDDEASAAAYAAGCVVEPPDASFRAAIEALFGPLGDATLEWDDAGVRAKLVAPEATEGDFELLEDREGGLHLLGIESPGLTAAMALAEEVAARLGG